MVSLRAAAVEEDGLVLVWWNNSDTPLVASLYDSQLLEAALRKVLSEYLDMWQWVTYSDRFDSCQFFLSELVTIFDT